jgi:hypothetical protein
MVHLVQTVHLSWIKISTIYKQIKIRFHLSLVTWSTIGCIQNNYWAYGTFGANRAPQTDRNELPPEPRHLGVPSGASKMISNPMVHLSKPCTYLAQDANSIFKWTKTRSDMTHVTKGFYRVRPKWFSSLWYVQHNASRLALSPNSLNRASTWASSTWSTIGSVQNDFLTLWYIWHKPWTYLAPTLTLSWNRPKQDSTWATSPGVPSTSSKMISKPMVRLVQTMHLSCIDANTISKWTETRFAMTHIT